MCVIFFMILYDHLLFLKKFIYARHFSLSNLDFVEPLGAFAIICLLNECLAFGMLI